MGASCYTSNPEPEVKVTEEPKTPPSFKVFSGVLAITPVKARFYNIPQRPDPDSSYIPEAVSDSEASEESPNFSLLVEESSAPACMSSPEQIQIAPQRLNFGQGPNKGKELFVSIISPVPKGELLTSKDMNANFENAPESKSGEEIRNLLSLNIRRKSAIAMENMYVTPEHIGFNIKKRTPMDPSVLFNSRKDIDATHQSPMGRHTSSGYRALERSPSAPIEEEWMTKLRREVEVIEAKKKEYEEITSKNRDKGKGAKIIKCMNKLLKSDNEKVEITRQIIGPYIPENAYLDPNLELDMVIRQQEDGQRYLGQINPNTGEREGYGILTFCNGAMYEGYWKDNERVGWGRLIDSDGSIIEGVLGPGNDLSVYSPDEYMLKFRRK